MHLDFGMNKAVLIETTTSGYSGKISSLDKRITLPDILELKYPLYLCLTTLPAWCITRLRLSLRMVNTPSALWSKKTFILFWYVFEKQMNAAKLSLNFGLCASRTKITALGQRKGFSGLDIEKLNKLYQCQNLAPVITTFLPDPNCKDVYPGQNGLCQSWKAAGKCKRSTCFQNTAL